MLGKIPRLAQIDFCNSYRCVLLYRIVFSTSEGHLASVYLFKVYKENARTMCLVSLKLTIRIPERRQWRYSGIFIVNLNIFHFSVSIVNISTGKFCRGKTIVLLWSLLKA